MDKIEVLTDFLNDRPTKIQSGIFEWRGRYYQVIYYGKISKISKPDHFIKWTYKGKLYGIREMSKKLLKKFVDIV